MGVEIDLRRELSVLGAKQKEILRTPTLRNTFSSISTSPLVDEDSTKLTRGLLNVVSLFPSKILATNDCHLHAKIKDNGTITFGFRLKETCEDKHFSQSALDELHDTLADLGQLDGCQWDKEAKTLTADDNYSLYDFVGELSDCLEHFDRHMSEVLWSAAASCFKTYTDTLLEGSDPTPTNEQDVIINALKSVISTFDNTDDFTVIATENDEEDSFGRLRFDISVGQNSATSFEKRYAALNEIYDLLEASVDTSPLVQVGLWPCQTCCSIEVEKSADIIPFIEFLFEETSVKKRALEGTAKQYITIDLLKEALTPAKRATGLKPYHH